MYNIISIIFFMYTKLWGKRLKKKSFSVFLGRKSIKMLRYDAVVFSVWILLCVGRTILCTILHTILHAMMYGARLYGHDLKKEKKCFTLYYKISLKNEVQGTHYYSAEDSRPTVYII